MDGTLESSPSATDWFSTPNKDGKPYDAPPTGPFDGAALATAEKDCLVESQNWPRSSRELFWTQAVEVTGETYSVFNGAKL